VAVATSESTSTISATAIAQDGRPATPSTVR
jgi:hypothetical protein